MFGRRTITMSTQGQRQMSGWRLRITQSKKIIIILKSFVFCLFVPVTIEETIMKQPTEGEERIKNNTYLHQKCMTNSPFGNLESRLFFFANIFRTPWILLYILLMGYNLCLALCVVFEVITWLLNFNIVESHIKIQIHWISCAAQETNENKYFYIKYMPNERRAIEIFSLEYCIFVKTISENMLDLKHWMEIT